MFPYEGLSLRMGEFSCWFGASGYYRSCFLLKMMPFRLNCLTITLAVELFILRMRDALYIEIPLSITIFNNYFLVYIRYGLPVGWSSDIYLYYAAVWGLYDSFWGLISFRKKRNSNILILYSWVWRRALILWTAISRNEINFLWAYFIYSFAIEDQTPFDGPAFHILNFSKRLIGSFSFYWQNIKGKDCLK